MESLYAVFAAFGLSASAGLNAYIPLLVIAIVGRFTDWISLAEPYDTLTNGWIILLLVVLSVVEFFADKVPAVNHVNDLIQTFVRPAAGAIAFAAATTDVIANVNPILALGVGLLVAGSVHVAKSTTVRPAVTATTGGVGNAAVSVAEDAVSTVLSILSVLIPVVVGVILVLATSLFIWWLWRRANREQRQQAKS